MCRSVSRPQSGVRNIECAINYHKAICEIIREKKLPYRALVAFSGENTLAGKTYTEAGINGFPDTQTADEFEKDENRILVVARAVTQDERYRNLVVGNPNEQAVDELMSQIINSAIVRQRRSDMSLYSQWRNNGDFRSDFEAKVEDDLPAEIADGADAAKWFRARMRFGDDREHFFVLPLDAAHKPLSQAICVSSGLLNGTPAGAREVFAQAVQWQASSIIVAHNHPSGDPTPSGKDVELTKELVAASKVLHIPLLDHLIIGAPDSADGSGFISIRPSTL